VTQEPISELTLRIAERANCLPPRVRCCRAASSRSGWKPKRRWSGSSRAKRRRRPLIDRRDDA